MISRTTEYALRASVWLAKHAGTPQTTRQIAAGTQVPAGYLAKVLQQLVDAKLVNSQRGLRGGFVLSRPAKQISVLDVVNAVDALERIRDCPLGIKDHEGTLCNLHRALDDAIATIERAFGSAMLGDLIEPGENGGLCSLSPKVTQLGRKSPTRPARK